MAWVALVAAGLFETGFAVCLKLSNGLRVPWPVVGFALCALTSFGLLTLALRELPVGPAYAVWTGIGAAGATTVGMIFLGDAVSVTKLVAIALILSGVVGLNLSGATPRPAAAAQAAAQAADGLDQDADGDRGAERDGQPGPDV